MSVIKITILLSILTIVNATVKILLTDTPITRIGPRLYKKILLTDQFQSPKELTYDSSSRNLYFMYMDDNLQDSGRAYINIVTKEAKKINGITRNKAIAVDSDTGDVYFGSDNGLYKYNSIDNVANNIGLYNMNIMKLVIRDNDMFLLDANNHQIYKVFNEGQTAVKAGSLKTVMQFEVDNQKNVHVVTMCGVYCAIRGNEVVKNKDLRIIYHFIVDDANTFGVNDDGIFDINCANGTARKLAELDFQPNSIIFGDYGDIFYSVDDSIFRLRPINSYLMYNLKQKRGST